MQEPTPEGWWNSLAEDDRTAYLDAVASKELSYELWQKMVDAHIPATAWAYDGNPLEYYMPVRFLRYVRERASERS